MNRKEEMLEGLPELRLENGGAALVDHTRRQTIAFLQYHNGTPEAVEKIVQAINALRASAAPEEGKTYERICAHEDCLNCQCSNDELCAGTQPRRALPSDSGKAEPDALIEKIATEAERYASHYPQSSDGRNTFIMLADFVRALAPATEGGGRETVIEECAKILDADATFYEGERKRLAKLHTTANSPYRDELLAVSSKRSALENCAALIRALSPSVGTPAQPSAHREGAAE